MSEELLEDVEVVEEAAEDASDDVVTDEMLDSIADTAIEVLQNILKYFNVGEVTIDEYDGDEGELILDITGDDLAVLIGRHGRTLDALQFLSLIHISSCAVCWGYNLTRSWHTRCGDERA